MNRNSADSIFRRYAASLHGFIRKQLSSETSALEDSEDLLHDVFYRFLSENEDIENVSAWLYRVARNLLVDRSRKKREESMPYVRQGEDLSLVPLSDIALVDSDTPETELAKLILHEEFEAALVSLPHEQRVVYELNELQGVPFAEMSEATGVPVNTLISRKRYAVASLRKRLRHLYE